MIEEGHALLAEGLCFDKELPGAMWAAMIIYAAHP